jgi:cation diffusion facilitator family transporter
VTGLPPGSPQVVGGTRPGESLRTVIVAGSANLAIAVAKAVAGLLSGSAAMLSEAAHSLADTVTEVLLFTALRRGSRRPDAVHPFGHGKESFFWALLAALGTLVAGAGFAVTHGYHTIRAGEDIGDTTPSYLVLAVAFAIESVSLTRALRQLTAQARSWRVPRLTFLSRTPDTALIAVVLEDSAALVGLGLAAAGLVLTQVTGNPAWDGASSIAIGVLLAAVAVALGKANASLLIGRAVSPPLQAALRAELERLPAVHRVVDLNTMFLGPDSVLVAAQVDFDDGASGAGLEAAAEDAARRLSARFPVVRHVYLDPTPGGPPHGGSPSGEARQGG